MTQCNPSDGPTPRRTARRPITAVALVLAAGCFAAIPSAALAASSKTVNYKVSVNPGVLARGRTVKANAKITNPEPIVASWWSSATISTVVRAGVNGGYQRPYASLGYRCTPVVRASTTSYSCKLRGADVPTSIELTFAVQFRIGFGGSQSQPGVASTQQFEFPIVVKISGQPADQTTVLALANAVIDPYPTTIASVPLYQANAPSLMDLPENAIVISSGPDPLNASLETAIRITDGSTSLKGSATLRAGTTLTISVNGRPAVPVSAGAFSIPLS